MKAIAFILTALLLTFSSCDDRRERKERMERYDDGMERYDDQMLRDPGIVHPPGEAIPEGADIKNDCLIVPDSAMKRDRVPRDRY